MTFTAIRIVTSTVTGEVTLITVKLYCDGKSHTDRTSSAIGVTFPVAVELYCDQCDFTHRSR